MKKHGIKHIGLCLVVLIGSVVSARASSIDSTDRYGNPVDSVRAEMDRTKWFLSIGGGFFKVPNRFESQGEIYFNFTYEMKSLSVAFINIAKPELNRMDDATIGLMVGRTWHSGVAMYSLMGGPGNIDNIYKDVERGERESGVGFVAEFKHSVSFKGIGFGAYVCININAITPVVYFSSYFQF